MNRFSLSRFSLNLAIWLAALLWFLPVLVAVWVSIHPASAQGSFSLFAPLTLQNFINAWNAAPFARYFLNTTLLVLMIVVCQLILATLADQRTDMKMLAERGVEIFFTQVFRDSFFHADMHPGNIFVSTVNPWSP